MVCGGRWCGNDKNYGQIATDNAWQTGYGNKPVGRPAAPAWYEMIPHNWGLVDNCRTSAGNMRLRRRRRALLQRRPKRRD